MQQHQNTQWRTHFFLQQLDRPTTTDYDNKTGTLIYTEPFRKFKKGATDDLINDNPTLIDEYGSIDFLDTVRTQVLNSIKR